MIFFYVYKRNGQIVHAHRSVKRHKEIASVFRLKEVYSKVYASGQITIRFEMI